MGLSSIISFLFGPPKKEVEDPEQVLLAAIRSGDKDMVTYNLLKESKNMGCVLVAAIQCTHEPHMFEWLCERFDHVISPEMLSDTVDKITGNTPAHIAARYNRADIIRYLDARTHPSNVRLAKNTNGQIPMHIACAFGSDAVYRELYLKNGPFQMVSVDLNNKTPTNYISKRSILKKQHGHGFSQIMET